MNTSATLLTTGSIIIGIAAVLVVVLVLVTMHYRKRQWLEDDTLNDEPVDTSSHQLDE